jgi:hypothetical protein
MDPYLEGPGLWPDVHNRLMNIFAEQLTTLIAPKYIAELNTQIVIDRIFDEPLDPRYRLPDVTITQPSAAPATAVIETPVAPAPLRLTMPMPIPTRLVSVYIRLRESEKVVTVIELLSPVNKRPGDGRRDYLDKRASYLEGGIHLIEIDLLRGDPRMPFEGSLPPCDYLAVVSSAYERPACEVWPITVRQTLPTLQIPLLRPDPSVPLDMTQALRTAYQRARYDLRIDYRHDPPPPPLAAGDAAWLASFLQAAGLRESVSPV